MTSQRTLALDYGEKRIGLAITDELGMLSQALSVVERKSKREDILKIKQVIETHCVSRIVVGLPRNMDGSYGSSAENARKFARYVEEQTGVQVILYDERLTTAMAQRTLIEADVSRSKRKATVDKVAAQMILQSFLDSERLRS